LAAAWPAAEPLAVVQRVAVRYLTEQDLAEQWLTGPLGRMPKRMPAVVR